MADGAGVASVLVVTRPDGATETYPLGAEPLSIGRQTGNAVILDDRAVSSHHATLIRAGTQPAIVDAGSVGGTFVNGRKLGAQRPWPLLPSDVVQIGPYTLAVGNGRPSTALVHVARSLPILEESAEELGVIPSDLNGRPSLSIGRADSCDLVLDHPLVSRLHALVERDEHSQLVILDHHSTNGVFVNGARVKRAAIGPGDIIHVGLYALTVGAAAGGAVGHPGAIQVDAVGISQDVGGPSLLDRLSRRRRGEERTASGGKRILSDVSLSIRPGEFVAVVGGSGNGKTTLVSALCGFKPPSSGKVLFNGQDLVRCFGVYRASIGYVPQDNILHGNLTLERALDFAAMLRLPPDTSAAERKQRVEEVLAELDLLSHRDTFIDDLSGGQRKRASIGVELLTRPSLFFLDEPTSGLDPVAETLIMRRLRELADQGRTLILVTHATQNIMLCDRVAFLSRGGRLAFFGRPRDALDFFMVEEFVDAYGKLESEPSVGYYARLYEASPYCERHTPASAPPASAARPSHVTRPSTSGARQFGILMRRSLELLLAPRRGARQALTVLLLQAPLIALCLGLIFPRAVFHERPIVVPPDQLAAAGVHLPPGQVQKSCDLSPDELAALPVFLQADWMAEPCGDTRKAMLMLFLLAIVAIWLGAFNGAKEIIREQAIYRRERLAVLGILPYVCSKIALLWLVSIVQAALLLAIIFGMIDFPPEPNVLVGTTAVILLTFAVATLFGLAISAVASSPEFSQMALPILLLPQMFFAGAMLALGEMGSGARYVSALTLSRWSWESLGAIVDLPRYAQAQGGPMLSLLEEHKWRHTFEIDPWRHAQILGLFGLAFLVVTVVALRRKDAL